jgi:quercetin dioxygenase-like cupin family protein
MSIEANTGEGGRTIHDPTTGEDITFLQTAEESSSGRGVMQLTLAPGGMVPPHAHPSREDFECLEGTLRFHLAGRAIELGSGNTLTALPGQVHGFRNVSSAPVTLRIVAAPGAEVEYGLRVRIAMAQDGAFTSDGRPKDLLIGAVLLHRSEVYLAPLPVWLYWPLIAALAALGRWRGKEQTLLARYPDYARLLDAVRRRSLHA